jgi:hypothetical protein
MARKFSNICAGMFLLALSYHLGARNAGAQGAGLLCAAANEGAATNWAVDSNGTLYEQTRNDAGPGPWYQIRTIPVTSKPVAILVYQASGGDTAFSLLTEDGTAYAWVGWQGTYTTSSVFSGGPTSALQQSWGQLKSRYAPNPTEQTRPGHTAGSLALGGRR